MKYKWKEFWEDGNLTDTLNKLEDEGWEIFQIIATTSTSTDREGDIGSTYCASIIARKTMCTPEEKAEKEALLEPVRKHLLSIGAIFDEPKKTR